MDYRIVICLALFVGCGDPEQIDTHEVDGWAASIIGNSVDAQVTPDDTPTPGGKCPTCNGTGKVGDGRVFSTCLDCDGKGVITSTPDLLEDDAEPEAETQGVTSTPGVQVEISTASGSGTAANESPLGGAEQPVVSRVPRPRLLGRLFGRRRNSGGLLRVTGSGTCAGGICR